MITLKPWGQEELLHQGYEYALKRISIDPEKRTSLHFHNIKHETIYVIKGILVVTIINPDNPTLVATNHIYPGEYISIVPKQIHRMSASQSSVIYLEAQSDHLDDVIRLHDDFRR